MDTQAEAGRDGPLCRELDVVRKALGREVPVMIVETEP